MAEVPIAVPASIRDEVVPSRKRVKLPLAGDRQAAFDPAAAGHHPWRHGISESWPLPLPRLACTLGGGALAAAAAGVLNCLWEEQLDGQMQRTSGRALPSGRLSGSQAFLIAVALACSASLLLVAGVNCLALACLCWVCAAMCCSTRSFSSPARPATSSSAVWLVPFLLWLERRLRPGMWVLAAGGCLAW